MGVDAKMFGIHESEIEKGIYDLLVQEQTMGRSRDMAIGVVRMAFEDVLRAALTNSDSFLVGKDKSGKDVISVPKIEDEFLKKKKEEKKNWYN